MPVSIIGGRSTGKSVFVTLLIHTAIKYSNNHKQHFRVYIDPATNDVVGEMLKSLKKSLWPPATIKGSLLEYAFSFGYSNFLTRALMTAREEVGALTKRQVKREMFYNKITFKLIDIAGENVEMLKKYLDEGKSNDVPLSEVMAPSLQYALNSDVVVFLIDSEKISTDRKDATYDEMLNYDSLLAQIYSFVAKYRSVHEKMKPRLYPVFVLTKFDAIPPNIRRELGVPDDFKQWVERLSQDWNLRRKFFENFNKTFYGQSLSQINAASLMGCELQDAQIFLSYALTELNEDGIMVPKVVKHGLANEPVFSETEYEAFIRYIGKIANNISDKKKGKEEGYAAGAG